IATISPAEARELIEKGAVLVDIRDADEHARECIPGGANIPLDRIEAAELPQVPVIYHCRSGMRTGGAADRLESAAAGRPCYMLEGGMEGWRKAGLPVRRDRSQPLEVMRQVQIAAGLLVLTGVILGAALAPAFYLLSGFVGAVLMMAGVTGWCGLATLVRAMPWNRVQRTA